MLKLNTNGTKNRVVNSGAMEVEEVPPPLVAPIVLIELQTR
jgi:hypothetical protein